MNAPSTMHAFVLAARLHEPRRRGSRADALCWVASFAVILGLHLGVLGYALWSAPDPAEGAPDDAINVELLADPSEQAEKPDDVAGPEVQDQATPTSEQQQAEDPDPPAPDAPPPTEVEKKPDTAPPELTAPAAPTEAEVALPPPAETPPQDKEPDPTPPVEKPPEAKPDVQERQTAPSQASAGSAALLSGGRRPSAAAQATWRGAIGTHLVHHRRYPTEARARGVQGVATVRVTIDGDGHVLDRTLAKSSGRPILDGEAVAMMKRADPFPKPPPGMPVPIVLTVPVKFAIR